MPLEAENPLAMLLAHVTRPVDLAALMPDDVPLELLRIIERCLAKSPQDRPRDARALAAELRAIRVPEAQSWSLERSREWWGRQPTRLPKRQPAAREAIATGEQTASDGAG